MTQPPDEPDASPPDEGWQAPGPAPVPPRYPGYGPPYDPPEQPTAPANPYGGGTTSYYQPIDSGAMSSTAKVVLGAVLGLCAGIFLWFVAVILFSAGGTSDGNDFCSSQRWRLSWCRRRCSSGRRPGHGRWVC